MGEKFAWIGLTMGIKMAARYLNIKSLTMFMKMTLKIPNF